MLLTRLTILIRTIGSALRLHEVRKRSKRGKRGLSEMTQLAPEGIVTKKRQDESSD